ncbi:muscarinic acetylcholine receptor M5-like [Patiria miniata]|uniref:G-protein coupled receptors family 1 profile domain-containing protein n=1 Tax=Patiria miniata TaxID=46514 RepID=A0A914B8Z5_PATMI|nr:muscarinic acetylcholine receptor M5-like [Patiria miniata]
MKAKSAPATRKPITILFISLDRYWLLTKKLAYGTFQTHKRAATMIAISWTISLLFYTVINFAWEPLAGVGNVDYNVDCELEPYDNIPYNAFAFVAEFVIPLFITSYLNAMVYINIRRRSKGIFRVQLAAVKLPRSPGERAESSERDQKDVTLELTTKSQGLGHNTAQALPEERSEPSDKGARKEIELTQEGAFNNLGFDEQIGDTNSQIKNATSDEKRTEVKPSGPAESPDSRRSQNHEVREFRRHRKAAITLSVLVSVFMVSWLPFYVTSMITAFCADCVSDLAWDVVNYLKWCNSTLNPFLYALLVLRFRENIMHFLCFRTCRNQNGRK